MFGGSLISTRLTETKGRTRGFDYLRALLSISVIAFHSVVTSYGDDAQTRLWHSPMRPVFEFILPSFFALSGFLVAGSLIRTRSLHEFLTLRVVRIVPALFFEVLISAMILGPLLTAIPLSEYFSSHGFWSYWLNIIGNIHFSLPGLFLSDPLPGMVNYQLWTIPIELRCYIAITIASILGVTRHRWRIFAIIAASMVALPMMEWFEGTLANADFNAASSKILYLCFLAGIAIYLYQDRLRLNIWFLVGSVVVTWVLLPTSLGQYVVGLPIAYITVYIGLLHPPKSVLSSISNYSYGLYIYGFVVQQSYSFLFPAYRFWWLNTIFSLSVAMLFAAVSWHFVEQPVLSHRARAVAAVNAVAEYASVLFARRRSAR